MASAPRERSISRRVSSFFTTGGSNGSHSPSRQSDLPHRPTSRPASRGRSPAKAFSTDSYDPPLLQPPTTYNQPIREPPSLQPAPPLSTTDHSSALVPPAPLSDGVPSRPSSRQSSSPRRVASSSNLQPDGHGAPPPPPTMGIAKTRTFSIENEKKLKRKSWLPGRGRSKSNPSADNGKRFPRAWIAARDISYDVAPLALGQRVPELWDETGDTLVHLFPKSAGKGPSFRVHSSTFTASATLAHLAFGDIYPNRPKSRSRPPPSRDGIDSNLKNGSGSLSSGHTAADTSSSASSKGLLGREDSFADTPRQISLYVPILSGHGALSSNTGADAKVTDEDVEALVGVRNMFAFLVSQSLVATESRQSLFSIFLKISNELKTYGFTNLDASTFGEHASARFDEYIEDLGLADVRHSREQTIESLVLGESMRSVMLYSEAFTHAVGKYEDTMRVIERAEPRRKFELVSLVTRHRMERAHIDLLTRGKSVQDRLRNFEFPSLWVGIMASKSTDARHSIQFGEWKSAFVAMRKHILSYYKQKYGSWPPKASSKKNELETSGLNRIVLKDLYTDFSDLYDLLVDRKSLTTRSNNDMLSDEAMESSGSADEPVQRTLRRVFDEYDRSTPPVQPPVPFDTPLLPMLTANKLSFTGDAKKDDKVRAKKLKDKDMMRLMDEATNTQVYTKRGPNSPFLAAFQKFERQKARGLSISEMTNLRAGMWIFTYCVIQALPLLVVDAPGTRFHQGVEYFLCEPPRAGVPWAAPDLSAGRGRNTRNWYNIAGGQGVVSLPSDLVEHGVEGVYRRSHCWQRAIEWSNGQDPMGVLGTSMTAEPQTSGGALEPPSGPHQHSSRLAPPALTTDVQQAHPSLLTPGTPSASPHGSRPSTPGSGPATSHSRPPTSHSAGAPHSQRNTVMGTNLEALPLPPGVSPIGGDSSLEKGRSPSTPHSRNASSGMTFDDIISGMDNQKKKDKRKSSLPFGN